MRQRKQLPAVVATHGIISTPHGSELVKSLRQLAPGAPQRVPALEYPAITHLNRPTTNVAVVAESPVAGLESHTGEPAHEEGNVRKLGHNLSGKEEGTVVIHCERQRIGTPRPVADRSGRQFRDLPRSECGLACL